MRWGVYKLGSLFSHELISLGAMNNLLNDHYYSLLSNSRPRRNVYQTATNKKTACDCLFIGEVSYTNKQTITS